MAYETIIVEKKDMVGTITLNRPDKLNSFTYQMFDEFTAALSELDHDDNVRVVVITGAGRAFSAGVDLAAAKEKAETGAEPVVPMDDLAWLAHTMRNMTKPIVGAINGIAIGAGFTIALACDIRIAAIEAKFSAAFLRVGLIPELGSTYNLPRLIGIAKACELIYTAKTITGQEAKEIGLVNDAVPAEELPAATAKLVGEITKAAPIALKIARQLLYQGLDADIDAQTKTEELAQTICFASEDMKEAARAFAEKRPPVFKGK